MNWQVYSIIQSTLTMLFVALALDDIVNNRQDNIQSASVVGFLLLLMIMSSIILTGLGV